MAKAALPDLEFRIWPDVGDPADIEMLVVWTFPPGFLKQFSNLKVLFSTGAGVDQLGLDELPQGVTLVRLLDNGIGECVAQYVLLSALALHRRLPAYLQDQADLRWNPVKSLPANRSRVGVMGLGNIGRQTVELLLLAGFRVIGWSRSPSRIDGATCFCGTDQFESFLAQTDILVCLLPLTDETRGILNLKTFNSLPRGASLINAGRGAHLVENDLLCALGNGQISAAALDVFEQEPLPEDHPFWHRTNVLITPHVAGSTQDESGGRAFVENLERYARGEPMLGVIDPVAGY